MKYLSFLICILCFSKSNSQIVLDIYGGINITKVRNNNLCKYQTLKECKATGKMGYTFGITIQKQFADKGLFLLGIEYFVRRYTYSEQQILINSNEVNYNLSSSYLYIPFCGVYKLNNAIDLNIGMYGEFGIGSNKLLDQTRYDFGPIIGINLRPLSQIVIKAEYRYGVLKDTSEEQSRPIPFNNHGLVFSLGYSLINWYDSLY